MKNSLLALLIFCGLIAKAQVPGYQGLRFSILYDAGLMHPALEGRRGTMPYLYHNVGIDYVLTRGLSLGIRYTFMFYNNPPNKLATLSEDYGFSTVDPNAFKQKYFQHCFTLIGKKFIRKAGYIAPVGRYISFGVYVIYAIDKSITTVAGEDPNSGAEIYSEQSFKGTAIIPGLHWGMGRNFVVANRLLIDIGGNVNLPLYFTTLNAPTESRITNRDVFFSNLVQLYVGLGVLAF